MIKKMNWGKGLMVGMGLFMTFIIVMCVRMFMAPADEYDHQYYEKGLNFSADYNKERQVVIDKATPVIQQSDKDLLLKFTAPAKGTIRFIRPSNQSMDKAFPITSGANNEVLTSTTSIHPGKYQVLLTWVSNQKEYRYQQEIYLR